MVKPSRPPAMTDVARLAGVSHQTVSRVLNEDPRVTPRTRVAVLAAVEELGYRRNLTARALATGRSRMLGVISFDANIYSAGCVVTGVEHAARAAGYFVSIVSLAQLDEAAIADAAHELRHQGVDGIVVISPESSAVDTLVQLSSLVPVVTVDGALRDDLAHVGLDQHRGAVLATEHLLSLGHATVWHIAGPPQWAESVTRQQGWRDVLTAAGREVPPALTGDWSARSGYEAGTLLGRMRDLTAVFAANDQMALGLCRSLAEQGHRVPQDVSVVGFDDIPEAAYLTPPLTTVRQDFSALGAAAFTAVRERIDAEPDTDPGSMVPTVLQPDLVVRTSTAAPAG